MTRFAAQRLLIDAPEVTLTSDLRLALGEMLAAAERQAPRRQFRVGDPRGPALLIDVSHGRASGDYLSGPHGGPSIPVLQKEPPAAHASLYFAPENPVTGAGRAGLLQRLRQELPGLLEQAGLRPGDLVSSSTVGASRGDYRRALTFMQGGMGPLDQHLKQFARIGPNYALEPALLMPAHEQSILGWY